MSEDHPECPIHSPCYSVGYYQPESCPPCQTRVGDLRASTIEERQTSPAWKKLKEHLYILRKAVKREGTYRGLTTSDPTLAEWFPSLIKGDTATPLRSNAEDGVNQSYSPQQTRPSLSPNPSRASSSSSRHSRLDEMMQIIMEQAAENTRRYRELAARLPAITSDIPSRTRSRSPDSRDNTENVPPAKRPRDHTSLLSRPTQASNVLQSDISIPSSYNFEGFGDDPSMDSRLTQPLLAAPSSTAGWAAISDGWRIDESTDPPICYVPLKTGGEMALEGVELLKHPQAVGHTYYYRQRMSDSTQDSEKEKVRALSKALASMSTRLVATQSPYAKLAPLALTPNGNKLRVQDLSLSESLTIKDMPTVWAARASGDKSLIHSKDGTRKDPRPFPFEWPVGSPEDGLFKFLQEYDSDQKFTPSGLSEPCSKFFKDDSKARADTLTLISVSTCMEVMASHGNASIDMKGLWSPEDFCLFLSSCLSWHGSAVEPRST